MQIPKAGPSAHISSAACTPFGRGGGLSTLARARGSAPALGNGSAHAITGAGQMGCGRVARSCLDFKQKDESSTVSHR